MPVAVVVAGLVLVALATHVVPPKYGRDRPPGAAPMPSATPSASPSPSPSGRMIRAGTTHPLALTVPAYVLLGIIVIGLVWGLTNAVLTRLRDSRRKRPRLPDDGDRAAAALLAGRVRSAVDEGLDDLAFGPVTDAIVLCWLRLVDAAEGAGVTLRRSDTPADTVLRVLDEGHRQVRPEPVQALAELYREARFSRHTMDEADRAAARSALEQIRADLSGRDRPAPTSGGPTHA